MAVGGRAPCYLPFSQSVDAVRQVGVWGPRVTSLWPHVGLQSVSQAFSSFMTTYTTIGYLLPHLAVPYI